MALAGAPFRPTKGQEAGSFWADTSSQPLGLADPSLAQEDAGADWRGAPGPTGIGGKSMFIHNARAAGALALAMVCLAACSGAPSTKAPSSTAAAATRPAATAAPAPGTTVATPATGTTAGIHLLDARPAKDKVFSIHSLWITSCNYGVYTVGDTPGSTPPMDLLRADLAALPDGAASSHDVRVDHYAMYYNPARKLKAGGIGAAAGVIGAMIASAAADLKKGSSCAHEKMDQGGWYGPGELTTDYPPLIIETAGMIDGNPFKSRTVYSPSMETGPKMKSSQSLVEFEAAVHKADKDLFAAAGLGHASTGAAMASAAAPQPPASNPPPIVHADARPEPAADDDSGWINTNPASAH
jgi:hypothetical protein